MEEKLLKIVPDYKTYDWGKTGSDSLVGRFMSNHPSFKIDEKTKYAELWIGTHSLSRNIIKSEDNLNEKTLLEVIKSDPEKYLGLELIKRFGKDGLPFLFKVLSVSNILSLQAHPDKILAKKLHSQDPKKYPDANHKPEMVIALKKSEVLTGFRPYKELVSIFQNVVELENVIGKDLKNEFLNVMNVDSSNESIIHLEKENVLKKVFFSLLNADSSVMRQEVSHFIDSVSQNPQIVDSIDQNLSKLVLKINEQFPLDIGLFIGVLFLNYHVLNPGQSMFIPANTLHAYISGDMLECMASSDNVVRAAFTNKFKDPVVLSNMLNYSVESNNLKPDFFSEKSECSYFSTILYHPPVNEFFLTSWNLYSKASYSFKNNSSPVIIIATNGSGLIRFKHSENIIYIKKGDVFYAIPNIEFEVHNPSDRNFIIYSAQPNLFKKFNS